MVDENPEGIYFRFVYEKMAKYLQQIDLLACKLYDEDLRIEFLEDTASYLESINERIPKDILSRFGKIVVLLWPIGEVSDEIGIVPSHEYDEMSNVATINVEYDLAKYELETAISLKQQMVEAIMVSAFTGLPDAYGLNVAEVVEILT